MHCRTASHDHVVGPHPAGIAYIEVDGTPLHRDEIEAFAISDGFDPARLAGLAPRSLIGATARETMGRFWRSENPGSRFEGVIIRWKVD
ncbi:hypothetical protein [Rhizobium sp. PDO1-076]|uniref:hypothetical protein n=1 Tax=Rhizobium sp. PDO1-076 TaxID=1125979 RepID=UPI0003175000|nr:hypothetical protein [Rhizobium sp. PDO1-076]